MNTLYQQVKESFYLALFWWIEGLCIPLSAKTQNRFFPQKQQVLIHVKEGCFSIDTSESFTLELKVQKTGPLLDLKLSLNDIEKYHNLDVLLSIEDEFVLLTQLIIPYAPKNELNAIIGFELERVTPFNIEHVFYDYSLDNNVTKDDVLTVNVCLAPKTQMQTIVNSINDRKTQSIALTTIDKQGNPLPINLLSTKKNASKKSYLFPLRPLYTAVAFLSFIILLQTPLWRYENSIINLENSIEQNRTHAMQLRREMSLINVNTNKDQFLANAQKSYLAPINLLNELSNTLPKHTWLQSFSLSNEVVQLEGESQSSAETLGIIENISFLEGAEFSAPVSNIGNTGNEKFQIISAVGRSNEY